MRIKDKPSLPMNVMATNKLRNILLVGMAIMSISLGACHDNSETAPQAADNDSHNAVDHVVTNTTEATSSEQHSSQQNLNKSVSSLAANTPQPNQQLQQADDYIVKLPLDEKQKGVLYLYADALDTIVGLNLQNETQVKQSGEEVFMFAGCVVDTFSDYTDVIQYTSKIESIILDTDSKRFKFDTFNNLLDGDFGSEIAMPEVLNCDALIKAHARD